MMRNNRIGDVSTVQAAPAVEIHLAAHVHNVQKKVSDHIPFATLTSHMAFPPVDVPSMSARSASRMLPYSPAHAPLLRQFGIVILKTHPFYTTLPGKSNFHLPSLRLYRSR